MPGQDFTALDEMELLGFFESEPVERDVDDGYWCYVAEDRAGMKLRFSFCLYERSVQTELHLGERMIARISHEGAVSMRREGEVLRCDFSLGGANATLVVTRGDAIQVEWATLRA